MTGVVRISQADVDSAFAREALPWLDDVYRFARSMCHEEADAEDITQDTYLRAYRSWHTFQIGTDCRRWLFTICRNVFRRRVSRPQPTVSIDAPGEADTLHDIASVGSLYADVMRRGYEDIFTRLDLAPALGRALRELPDVFRSVLILVDVEDQSYDAASEILGIPVGTVRSRLFRARRMVQGYLVQVANDAGVGLNWRAKAVS